MRRSVLALVCLLTLSSRSSDAVENPPATVAGPLCVAALRDLRTSLTQSLGSDVLVETQSGASDATISFRWGLPDAEAIKAGGVGCLGRPRPRFELNIILLPARFRPLVLWGWRLGELSHQLGSHDDDSRFMQSDAIRTINERATRLYLTTLALDTEIIHEKSFADAQRVAEICMSEYAL